MDFNTRLEVALAQTSAAGIWQNNYAPPIYRLLWFFGIEVPPPHFASFGFNLLLSGAWFGASWAAIMWLLFWSHQGGPPVQAVAFAILVGALFGLLMASYYAFGARRYRLPRWSASFDHEIA